MRVTQFFPLLALGSALVITDDDVFQNIHKTGQQVLDTAKNALDDAIGKANDAVKSVGQEIYHKIHETDRKSVV